MMPIAAEWIGDTQLLYASDYPHWDTECPNTMKHVVERNDIPDKTKQNILADNAKAFYRFA
jgi:predicted TIM-barrel fold metal-dependent hydrolase